MNPGLAGLGAAFCWGAADFAARFNGRSLGTSSTLFFVMAVSSALLAPLAFWDGAGWLAAVPGLLPYFAVASVATVAGLWLLYETLTRGPLNTVVPVLACYPAPLVLWTVLVEGVSLSALHWAAMAVTLAGVWTVARAGHRTLHKEGHALGNLSVTIAMAAVAVLAFDIDIVAMNEMVARIGNVPAVWATRVGGLAVLGVVLLARRHKVEAPRAAWGLLTAQAALDVGGFVLLFLAGGEGGTALATVTSSSYGVITVLMARLFLKEVVSPQGWAGLALVFLGVASISALS